MEKPLSPAEKGTLSTYLKVFGLVVISMLSACSSAPQIKYPSGSSARLPINSVLANSAFTPNPIIAKRTQTQTISEPAATVAQAIPIFYAVNDSERSVLAVLRRWSRANKTDFSWNANIDYAITARMRGIQSETYNGAVVAMNAALVGVAVPLKIALGTDGLFVTLAGEPVIASLNIAVLPPASAAPVISQVKAAPAVVVTAAVVAPPVIAAKLPPPPNIAALSGWGIPASVIPDQSVDAAARKAGGVMSGRWLVNDTATLRSIVEIWATQSGYRVDWNSTLDYPVNSAVKTGVYTGTFKEALGQLAGKFGELPQPLGMQFSENGLFLRIYDLTPPAPPVPAVAVAPF